MVRMGPMVRATEDPPRSRPTSRHLTSPLTIPRELRRCRLAWRLPPTRSHGGSQGSNPLTSTPQQPWSAAWRIHSAGPSPFQVPLPGSKRAATANETANRYSIAAKRRSEADTYPTFRLRVGCSASIWTAPDGSSLLTLDASSVQTALDGYRRIVWMIKRMIKGIR
jgi:hypothetical protein